ncbi:hypothetical protein ELY21_09830 [Legionella sp. km535]|nr:hypothetical protein ELY21_09830 [Legionella sp. km535]
MKLPQLLSVFILLGGINSLVYASGQLVVSNCPENCTSCWEQCTKDDDCGVEHKCISTPCGNRCVKEISTNGQ